MPVSAHLCDHAIFLFEQQWRRECARLGVHVEHLDASMHWLMSDLLRLAQELADGPMLREQLHPLVHRRVEDLDSVSRYTLHEDGDRVFERYVDTLVAVIDEVRRDAREHGTWIGTDANAAPLMCG